MNPMRIRNDRDPVQVQQEVLNDPQFKTLQPDNKQRKQEAIQNWYTSPIFIPRSNRQISNRVRILNLRHRDGKFDIKYDLEKHLHVLLYGFRWLALLA